MDETTLVLEGLPVDFDSVVQNLESYFKDKEKSGGQAVRIVENPEDKRKALLLYNDGGDAQKVLSNVHNLKFNDLGSVELRVKMQERANAETSTVKPPLPPRRKKIQTQEASVEGKQVEDVENEIPKEVKANVRCQSLIISSSDTVDKDILTMYFEQFSEQVEVQEHKENMWILNVPNHSDLLKILAVKEHDFGISVDLYEDESVVEKLDPRRFILTGFKDTCNYKYISLLINNCSKKTEHSWEFVDESRIVVTFNKDIDVNSFLTKCANRKLQGNDIKASQLELTDSVLVVGDLSQIGEDILTGHFSSITKSGGGDIQSVFWINKQKTVIITFKNCHAAYRVLEQKHNLSGVDLTVLLFYSNFKKALTGQIPTLSGIQTTITIPVDVEVLNFIVNNQQCRKDLQNQLNLVRASVVLEETTLQRKLVVEMDVEKESLAALYIGPTWEKNVRRAAQEFLKKYSAVKLPVEVTVWKSVENTCLALVTAEADTFFLQSESKIVIVGLTELVNVRSEKIKNIVKGATTNQIKERNTSTWETSTNSIPLKSVREMEFIQSVMNVSGIPEFRQLGIILAYSCDAQSTPCLKVTAAKEKIQDAVSLVKKHLPSIVMEKLTYSKPGESKVLKKNEAILQAKAKEWNCKLYFEQLNKTCGPPKTFQCNINNCITLTITQGDLHHWTADALVCPMTTNLTFDNPTAQEFLKVGGSQIQEVFYRAQREKQALLAGEVIPSKSGQLSAKTLIYAVLPQGCQPLGPHYLKTAIVKSLHKAEEQSCESIAMPVLGSGTFQFPVKQSCTAIREAIVQFIGDHQNAQKNVKNIFVVESDIKVFEEFNSLVAEQGFYSAVTPISPAGTPTKVSMPYMKPKYKSETSVDLYGLQVCLKRGDITKETADVIVNSNNWDLNLSYGVCGAIFKAAGKSIEKEYIQNGPIPGEVTFTTGGNLSCKFIAHIFGPSNASDITDSIGKVLQLCETTKVATVTIPAIGTGRGGISAYESITGIFTALENHLLYLNSSGLKKITVVAFEEIIWDAYRDYFRKKNRQSLAGAMPNLTNQVTIKDTKIEIKKGDITTETTQAIVNPTNKDINLKAGVSGAIFRAAGSTLEKECRKLQPLEDNTVAVTRAGNLKCNFIIHMLGTNSASKVQSRVKKVLEQCEQNKITTISFPAIGTGAGGIKGVDAMNAMLQAFEGHLSLQSSSALKHIYVVVDRDEVLQDFQRGLTVWAADIQEDGDEDEDEYIKATNFPEEKERRTSGSFRHAAELFWDPETGFDLDKLDPELKRLFGECGISETQLKDKGISSVIYEFIVTKGGLEAVKEGLDKEVKLMKMMKDKEKEKDEKEKEKKKKMLQKKKLTKEAIGSPERFKHVGHASLDLDTMDPELKNFFSMCDISEAQLKDMETANVIHDFIEKKGGVEAVMEQLRREASKPSQLNESNQSPAREPLCLLTEMANISFPAITVEVYGTSPDSLAKVKKLLDELISEECSSKDVQGKYLANLKDADKEAIVRLSKENEVHVLVVSSEKLTVSGKKDNVLNAVLNISTIIQEAKDRDTHEFEKRRLSQTLCWQVAEGDSWVPLDSDISYKLELAFHKKEQVFTYEQEGEVYTVDFKELIRRNQKRMPCRIRRTLIGDSDTAIIQPPPTWTKMEGEDLQEVVLQKDSEEYKKIETEFLTSSKHGSSPAVQVLQIRRIQNNGLWQRYCVLKKAMDKKYPNQKNEQFLYHGTTQEFSQKINKNGFNRSFCGRNAVVHGLGTYFAKEAWYSCQDKYSNPDLLGMKHIYRARVVTGSPCKSREGMKEPDPLDPNDPQAGLHNCAVDNLQKPLIFVVFCDAGAYPDYLITFRNAEINFKT
ncbi:protein mono-ADP-ribosyltransferase PARP14-like [Astyanax mexicanus]|uniref:protein mono-ADP-ribosyltransferase PARP14-like n=1 Tax=Astyanax mexicanus TaxID=7994 RepID=UPI0020CAA4E8|nr:protein mono-ADP-ribosyltransferase PARP14-like [Astyanax mexicanus]